MAKIKIISNPYDRQISFFCFNQANEQWEDIKEHNANSRLREIDSEKTFFPFKIKEVIDIIIDEYDTGTDVTELVFEGTTDDYTEMMIACGQEQVREKISLSRRVERMQEVYKASFPDIAKRIISFVDESLFVEDYRVMSYVEILDAQDELHVPFTAEGLIPFVDCMDNDKAGRFKKAVAWGRKQQTKIRNEKSERLADALMEEMTPLILQRNHLK